MKTFTQNPTDIGAYGALENAAGNSALTVLRVVPDKAGARVQIDGVRDRNAAEALKGTELWVARDRFPPVEDDEDYYHADLIGLAARDGNGKAMGRVAGVYDFGAGDVLEIAGGALAGEFIPFTRANVPEIDLAKGFVTIIPISFTEARSEAEAAATTAGGNGHDDA